MNNDVHHCQRCKGFHIAECPSANCTLKRSTWLPWRPGKRPSLFLRDELKDPGIAIGVILTIVGLLLISLP